MLPAAVLCLLGSVLGDYPTSVHEHLSRAAPRWLKSANDAKGAVVGVLELGIDADGTVTQLSLAHRSEHNDGDDLLRAFVLDAEPLPAPAAGDLTDGRRAVCLVRAELARKELDTAVACFPPSSAVPKVAGLAAKAGSAADAGARLFAGWMTEGAGNVDAAESLYAKAHAAAPRWDYAARAYGLALVRAKRFAEAMPLLQVYLASHEPPADVAAYARELKRFAKYQEAQEAPRKRLGKNDLAEGIADGFDDLEVCLEPARKAAKLALAEDTLIMSFKIRKDGSVYAARLEGPKPLVMTTHSECLERKVEGWRFRSFSDGDDLAVNKIPIKVRGASKEDLAPPPPAHAAADMSDMQASFSSCQRDQREIMTFVSQRMAALTQCVVQERKRAPHAQLPDALPIRIVVEGGGALRGVQINHRHFRTGPMSVCVQQALSGKLAQAGGADCPAQFELNLRGM